MRLASAAFLLFALSASAEDRKPVVLRFELEANLIWVDVRFDGKGPYRMAVDTGASMTVVLPDVAQKLGLIDREHRGVVGGLDPVFVTVKETEVGLLFCEKLKVAVMDLPQLSETAQALKLRADGILGYNFLARYRSTFDYDAKTISLVETGFVPEDPETALVARRPLKCWFGVQAEEVAGRDTRFHGYDGGLRVTSVEEYSPAAKAGLREGDVLVEVAGSPVVHNTALRDVLRARDPDQMIVVMWIRDGELWEADVTLGKPPLK
jgi:predicted aspartyl protease